MMDTKTILIVEDEQPLLEAMFLKLSSAGYSVLKANDGVKGLDIALKNHPVLILLDVVMPIMDGFTMLHKLREDPWGKEVSVIILTNLQVDDERLSHIVTDQPSYYLLKSDTSLDKIIEKVQEILISKEKESKTIASSDEVEEK